MGFFSTKDKGKSPAPHVCARALQSSASSPLPHQRVNIRVHQARWHWEHRIPLPYPYVTLPHDWHLDSKRILVRAMARSARAHVEEVRRRWEQLMLEQRHNPTYAADSLDWEAWFAWEHKEHHRRGVRDVVVGSSSPLIVCEEEQEAEAE
ncbi:hypothetical protein D1007_24587 [Hordeum vulgare]|nr:hypothetical protein D1007_24587 [Hordeum vulgare]